MDEIEDLIAKFFEAVAKGTVEIYNEFSLQHELGCFLRQELGPRMHRVQFERAVEFFNLRDRGFQKREIDIVVSTASAKAAIELKFPRNGQYPEQMFKACEDICFLEQLVEAGFDAGYFVMTADDHLFFRGPDCTGIYAHFRSGKPITGTITKPTGKRDSEVAVRGHHQLIWHNAGACRYACVRIGRLTLTNAGAGR